MTEEDARKKWCPMARIGLVHGMAVNKHAADKGVDEDTRCLASDCMMWRATDNECLPQAPSDASAPTCKSAGYCGLAGKPLV